MRELRTYATWVAIIMAPALILTGCGSDGDGPDYVPAQAEPPPPVQVLTTGLPYGLTLGDWGAEWWNWVVTKTTADSPVLDLTGALCDLDQHGPVWFLCGTFGGDAERTCTVPAGRQLFFPVSTWLMWAPEDAATEAEVRALASDGMDTMTGWCRIDGVDVGSMVNFRDDSAAFHLPIGAGTIFNEWGYPPGIRYPAVADGFWIMTGPMPPGEHLIEFSADDGGGFVVNVTYHLIVVE